MLSAPTISKFTQPEAGPWPPVGCASASSSAIIILGVRFETSSKPAREHRHMGAFKIAVVRAVVHFAPTRRDLRRLVGNATMPRFRRDANHLLRPSAQVARLESTWVMEAATAWRTRRLGRAHIPSVYIRVAGTIDRPRVQTPKNSAVCTFSASQPFPPGKS